MGLEDLRGLLATKIPLLTELGDALRLTEPRSVANLRCCQAVLLRLQTSSIVNDSSKREFHIETRLQVVHLTCTGLRLATIGLVTWIILRMALNRPIQIPLGHAVILLIVLPLLMCITRMAWGRSIMFDSSGIEFLRGKSKLIRIPRNSVQEITAKKRAISFKYQLDGQTKF